MPRRNLVLTTSEIYHIFNRSIAKQNIFGSKYMLNKVLEIIDFYRFPQEIRLSKFNKLPKEKKQSYFENYRNKNPFVEIYAFAFMPNHFHFLLKQIHENLYLTIKIALLNFLISRIIAMVLYSKILLKQKELNRTNSFYMSQDIFI